jgi:hypothetical protein
MCIEAEIRNAINKLDEINGAKTDESVILRILASRSIYRWININNIDTIAGFLGGFRIISLILTSKTMLKFLPETWLIIHNLKYPKSILPKENYVLLKNQMMTISWYRNMYNILSPGEFEKFNKISKNEEYINKRRLENDNSKDKLKKHYNELEIKAYINENKRILEESPQDYFSGAGPVFEKFKKYDVEGMTFFRCEIDMRLYGLDENNPADFKKWHTVGVKWAKNIYNEEDIEWELYDGHFSNEEPDWCYAYEEKQVGYTEDIERETHLIYELCNYKFKYRYRKIPDFSAMIE